MFGFRGRGLELAECSTGWKIEKRGQVVRFIGGKRVVTVFDQREAFDGRSKGRIVLGLFLYGLWGENLIAEIWSYQLWIRGVDLNVYIALIKPSLTLISNSHHL